MALEARGAAAEGMAGVELTLTAPLREVGEDTDLLPEEALAVDGDMGHRHEVATDQEEAAAARHL